MIKITYFTAVQSNKIGESKKQHEMRYKTLFLKSKNIPDQAKEKMRALVANHFNQLILRFNSDISQSDEISDESIDLYLSSPICILDLSKISNIKTIFLLVYFASITTEVGGTLFITASKDYFYPIKSLLNTYLSQHGFKIGGENERILCLIKVQKYVPIEFVRDEIFQLLE